MCMLYDPKGANLPMSLDPSRQFSPSSLTEMVENELGRQMQSALVLGNALGLCITGRV